MDLWESTIEDYHQSQTLDSFNTVLHTAEGILKQDLAQFELDWFIQTLLSEPVSLLDIISARSSDDVWSKVVKDAYKLLGDIVEKHYDAVQEYIDSIIEQCKSPHDARTRSHALQCLASCLKRTQPGELASQYISELGQASTCKAPLALLVGTICEHHPEVVADEIIIIWRTYLNMLASNQNSDLVCKSLLRGVWCLFKHFGSDIPVNELTNFYDKLSDEYLKKCSNAVLPILRDYSSLFKEKLAGDLSLRRQLWLFDDFSPIIPVYVQVASVMTRDEIQNILLNEIIPKTTASSTKLKFTALRVCTALKYNLSADIVNVYSLEYQLRGEVTYEVAEAVSWCIESNVLNSEKLLQSAIIFYHNLPENKKKDIVVNGLLNAPANVMHATLNFLISESCQDDSLKTYLPLWRDLFASHHDLKDTVFDKFMGNVLVAMENFLEDTNEDKKIPDKLASLLTLTSHIIPMQEVDDPLNYQLMIVASKLVELSLECGLEACVISVVKVLVPLLGINCDLYNIFQMLHTDRCKDEASLCETCLALLGLNSRTKFVDDKFRAIEVILSRKDAEPKTLSMAIKKIEEDILTCNFDSPCYSECIALIEKLRTRKDLVGKDARILHRDVTYFLGKYSNSEYINEIADDNSLVVQLKDVLMLDIPNPTEGTTYKINLNRLLHLAVTNEHEDTLKMLLNIICANLCNSSSPLLQEALGRVVVALCRATVGSPRPDARHAAAFCDVEATLYILQQISQVKSPAVRRMLANTIEGILLKEGGSEANERILTAVYEEVCTMMKSDKSILKLGGLEITESLITALKKNRHQTKQMLPSLLTLISKTNEQDSHTFFENASELYIENIALFGAEALDIVTHLIRDLLDSKQELKAKIYKDIVKSTLKFISNVMDCTEVVKIIMASQNDIVRFTYVWSEMSKCFDIKDDYVKEMFDYDNCVILNAVFNGHLEDSFALEANLRFINRYASTLLKFHNEATLKHISAVIEKLTSEHIKSHWKLLSECLTHVRQICQNTPLVLLKSLEIWSECIPIKNITEHVEKHKFLPEHELYIHALDKMIELFNLKDPTSLLTTVSIFAKTWAKTILKLFASDRFAYMKEHFTYLSVLLSVSLRFLTLTDVKNILREGHGLDGAKNAKLGVDFCRFFISVFIKYLVKKPFLLVHDDMLPCWMLLNDVVKLCVRKRWHDDQLENVLELVDQLWPTFESKASFEDKHTLLLDLSCLNLKLSATSRPMRWVTAIVGANDADRDERIALVMVLPGGEEYSGTYRKYASLLPTRLSDMGGPAGAAFRSLLDALSGNADDVLLDIVFTLADGDDTPGWWDEAMSSCMASLAVKASMTSPASLAAMHARCRTASPAVYRRLLVPFIRCSPSSACEKFFASILKESLEGLSSGLKQPSLHPDYRSCVQKKTIALEMFLVLIEKVPAPKIESPSSSLYEHIETDKPWHLLAVLIRICFKLRDKLVTPEGASIELSNICREFQQIAYKFMCACICLRRPDAKIYNTVFNIAVWTKIVDENVDYNLPLKTQWNQHKVRKPVPILVTGGKRLSRGSSSRRRLFLRTLSENPMDYDLNEYEDDKTNTELSTQDIELSDSSLNNHPCAGTLTALCQHAASLAHHEWLLPLREALTTAPRNVRWLLAMAICNSKEDLKPHAAQLLPALLAVISDTSQGTLNSLHVDILNTLIYWECAEDIPHLNTCVKYLVRTALNNSARPSIFKMLEEVLGNMLRIYGVFVQGDLEYFDANFDERIKHCLKLLLRFVRNKVRVPNLLSWLLRKLSTNYKTYRSEMSVYAEVIGIEMANSSQEQKTEAAGRLKKILEDVRKNNISDYVKIMNCSGCCDAQQFRVIVDLTQKLLGADQKKCLNIISTYISEHPDSPETADVPADVMQMVDRVSLDRQFDGLFTTAPQLVMPPPAKRVKTEVTSPILNTIGRNEKNISNVLAHKGVKMRVEEKLCKNDMALRFVECFYIAVYLPMKYESETDLYVCLSAFYNMLFSHWKTQDNFKQKKLRDEPWIVSHPIGMSSSRSKKMVGTLRSFAYNATNANYDIDSGIDVQVPIEKILDTLLEFAKVTPEASLDLLTQLLQCLTGRGFDPRCELSRLLVSLLTTTPQLVVLARHCVDQLSLIDGFLETIEELKKTTLGSEGEQLFRLLYEETKLRRGGPHLFVLGTSYKENDDIIMSDNAEFSIEGLVSSFQKLSNWDELTRQERKRIENELPTLWTNRIRSIELLNQYTATNNWFGEMVQLYRHNRKDVMKWLRIVDKWPRRQFLVSSIVEATEWTNIEFGEDELRLPYSIHKNDCLAEWAGRLFIRAAYEKSVNNHRLSNYSDTHPVNSLHRSDGRRRNTLESASDEDFEIQGSKLSRSHELRWCECANERGLYNLALSVIKRNHLDLDEDETLQWLEQKMLASTMMAFELNDRSAMEKALESARFFPEYYEMANTENVIGVNKLIMELHYKLQSLSSSTVNDITIEVDKQITRINEEENISTKNKKNLASLYEIAILYYDALWDKNELSNDEILLKMCEYLGRYDQSSAGGVCALILNRLASCDVIGESVAAILLAKMKPLIPKLPPCYIDLLKEKIHLFPARVISSCGIAELEEDIVLDRFKESLQLLCHADYLLLQCCHDLKNALHNDTKQWDAIFSRMMRRVFENNYSGADYQALAKYKNTLNAIRTSDLEMKRIVLKGIIEELETAPVRETIRLTHVCPSLAALPGRGLERLLRLPAGVLVVKIEEELHVFTNSKQRPCVVTVVTSDGRKRRYLLKNEDLRADAAGTAFTLTPYTVIPLNEDCGLIEFLEDHKPIRDLIASTCRIDDISETRQAAKDEELVLASKTSSIQNYNEICSKIPAYALRSAIENHSASIQDFISKKRRFLDTLSDMTIVNWLFGLGDRHLENMLYSIQDGGVRCIDWGAILRYCDEIPPARLTRNLLAVCDNSVLESRLQKKLSSLRDSQQFTIPVIKLSFRWMENFEEKMPYIEGILQGKMVAHEITKEVLQKSNWLHKTKYIQLLEAVFENHVEKEIYSIEEQVSRLLLQCTDPWILSVTRTGWEPWL